MLPLFFVSEISDSASLTVTGDEAHHAITVTRLSVGNQVMLSDGQGTWAQGAISVVDKKSFSVVVSERGTEEVSSPRLSVVQALPKSDRVKEAIELMVEAGVDRIIPWAAARSISKWQSDAQIKWQVTAQTATKQSRRKFIPEVLDIHSTIEIAAKVAPGSSVLVLHEEGSQKISSVDRDQLLACQEIYLVIGPEGGISPEEIDRFTEAGTTVVRLGVPVLRSAHAAIAGLAAVQTLIGRW